MVNQNMSYTHFVYFNAQELADSFARTIEVSMACITSVYVDSNGEWVVDVSHPIGSQLDPDLRELVRRVAADSGGEYDGGEAGPIN